MDSTNSNESISLPCKLPTRSIYSFGCVGKIRFVPIRKQAEINKAIADKSYQNEMGMTITQYLSLRQLEIEKEKIELIKDKKDITIIFGQGSIPTTMPIK